MSDRHYQSGSNMYQGQWVSNSGYAHQQPSVPYPPSGDPNQQHMSYAVSSGMVAQTQYNSNPGVYTPVAKRLSQPPMLPAHQPYPPQKLTIPPRDPPMPPPRAQSAMAHYSGHALDYGHRPPSTPYPQQYGSPSSPSSQYPASPQRPYACDLCPLSFNRQHDLKRHRDTHSGEKPFQCPGACGKTFTRKDALKRHQLVKRCGLED